MRVRVAWVRICPGRGRDFLGPVVGYNIPGRRYRHVWTVQFSPDIWTGFGAVRTAETNRAALGRPVGSAFSSSDRLSAGTYGSNLGPPLEMLLNIMICFNFLLNEATEHHNEGTKIVTPKPIGCSAFVSWFLFHMSLGLLRKKCYAQCRCIIDSK